jgi:PHP domain
LEETVRIEGHLTAEQVRQNPYFYLPFNVPSNASRIHVSYGYSDPVTAPFGNGPGNVVDIGIFDSRGYDFPQPAGFRGWSGAARPEFFLAREDATPGYIRGHLFPGEWNIMLGVDRVEPEGVRYDVSVTVEQESGAGNQEPGGRPRSAHPAVSKEGAEHSVPVDRHSALGTPRSPRWLKGDLHCHTVHSDGLNSVEEIVRNAVELGLDFLAVTDHNTSTHFAELERLSHLPTVLIPGEEVTTYWGHANMWGLREWIDFRCADEASIDNVRRYVLQKGGLISVNHPKCVGPPWFFRGWEGYPSMEVWQAPWRFYNWESLERWDSLLRSGQRVVAVGGSDVHSIPPAEPRHPHGLANPTTWVYSEPTEVAILDAIRAGHVYLTDAPNDTQLILTADADGDGSFETLMGDTIAANDGRPVSFRVKVHGGMDRRLWLIADGVPIDIRALDRVESKHEYSLDVSDLRYVRAELRGHRGRPERGEVVWAMTNPIWVGHPDD